MNILRTCPLAPPSNRVLHRPPLSTPGLTPSLISHSDPLRRKWLLRRRDRAPSSSFMVRSLDSYSAIKDVTYSCGYCGYALNLSSSARDTAGIGSKYGKQIKKGVVSFLAVDESRFTQADEVACAPYFRSSRSWALFRKRSRLLCRKCGGRIGTAYEEEEDSAGLSACDGSDDDLRTSSSGGRSGGGASSQKNYVIRISALQPSSDDSALAPFTL